MVIALLICTLFCVCSASLEAAPMTRVEAGDINYDGKKIDLKGDVVLNHQFGDITCDKAILLLSERDTEAKMMMPQRILLFGNVYVKLRDESIITSEEADIYCPTLEGVFTAEPPQKVVYNTFMGEGKARIPIKASSRAMKVIMKKSTGPNASYIVQDMQAEGAVTVEYQNALQPASKTEET